MAKIQYPPKIDRVLKLDHGDDGSLVVIMGKQGKRYVVYSQANGKLMEVHRFNKKENAYKEYMKILGEF